MDFSSERVKNKTHISLVVSSEPHLLAEWFKISLFFGVKQTLNFGVIFMLTLTERLLALKERENTESESSLSCRVPRNATLLQSELTANQERRKSHDSFRATWQTIQETL